MTLGTFAFKILHKSFVKIGIVFLHVLKRITHSLWLDKIFIQLANARRKKTHNFWNKNHIQPQTIGDPIFIPLPNTFIPICLPLLLMYSRKLTFGSNFPHIR